MAVDTMAKCPNRQCGNVPLRLGPLQPDCCSSRHGDYTPYEPSQYCAEKGEVHGVKWTSVSVLHLCDERDRSPYLLSHLGEAAL
jgi:hypothetical protein